MTIEKCLSICRSKEFRFSGLEWSFECHCGNEPIDGFKWTWSDKCDDHCSGDSTQICGGSEALSVWSTPPKNLNGYCVNDYPGDRRVLNDFAIIGLTNLTKATCENICEGKSIELVTMEEHNVVASGAIGSFIPLFLRVNKIIGLF